MHDISALNRSVVLSLAKEGAGYKAELAALQLAHDEVILETSTFLETLRATLSDLKSEQSLFADQANAHEKYEFARAANNLGTMKEMDAILKQIHAKNAPRRLRINKTVTSLSRIAKHYNITLAPKDTQEHPPANLPAKTSSPGAAGAIPEVARQPNSGTQRRRKLPSDRRLCCSGGARTPTSPEPPLTPDRTPNEPLEMHCMPNLQSYNGSRLFSLHPTPDRSN